MDILLSVIVPVYNTEAYLAKCLDSIINQNYHKLEIICINDGSTDKSAEILASYAAKDHRIKVINQANQGLSAARNAGIQMATGQYITFVDSDDYINLETYDLCLPLFLLNIDIVVFSVNVVDEGIFCQINDHDYFQVHHMNAVNITPKLLINENVMAWNKIYKTDIIKYNHLSFPKDLWYEDTSFYWQYMSFVKNAYFLDNQLYNYIRHSDSIMFSTFLGHNRSIDSLKVYAHILSFWLRNKKFNNFIQEIGALLFEKAFSFAYNHATVDSRDNVIELARKIIDDYQMTQLFSQNQLILYLKNNQLHHYNWIDTYNFVQKLFSIKHFNDGVYIYIGGIQLCLKNNQYKQRKKVRSKSKLSE